MPPRRVRARPATPSDQPEDSSPAGDNPIADEDLDDDIPPISWNVNAQSSPHPPLPAPSVAAVMASSPAAPGPAARVDLVQAAALAENVPGVTLVPPSDEEGASRALLTPPPHNPPRRLRSGGSSASAPPRKKLNKGKGQAVDLPADLAGLPGPPPTIHIPPRPPPLTDFLERLLTRPPSPSKVPLPSSDWIYRSAVLLAASRGLDLKDPAVHPQVLQKLMELAPGVDFTDLLEQAAHTPTSLDGFDLPCPAKVISALKNNWTVHIPITALTTCTIASASFATCEDAGHTLLFKEGQLTVSSSKFSSKDESSITAQEWFHAFPRLVDAIRRYLPGEHAGQVADAWAVHFNRLVRRADFWEMFHAILCYDIRLRIHFIDPKCGIDPSLWQEEVWRQIVDAYHNNTQHLLPGLAVIPPPKATPFLPALSTSSTSSALAAKSLASSSQTRPIPSQPIPSAHPSSSQLFCCLFCGNPSCRRRACGLTRTAFISFSNNVWQTAQGEQVCFCFNGRGCTIPNCPCLHVCSRCGTAHSAQSCGL
ncbi:hypothetical protein JVT61DRAFT_8797 [Boletus reticuloceps]|uniref:Uncharacterized protein n=1 Tax=Boletus reticuloceps TaxID=495285 RepID=A0A8I2YH05_9AGAM|nr:hypothetical protein JVT61DRAFT_8797 [Boletus reticuloceps]